MPSVPIEMPSEMEIVFTSIGVPPAWRMPSITRCARARCEKLQGMVPIHSWATITSGFLRSSASYPTACRYERAAARSGPSTIVRLRCRMSNASAIEELLPTPSEESRWYCEGVPRAIPAIPLGRPIGPRPGDG